MAEFVRFTLDDGSQVLFESAESDLVALRGGGPPEVRDGGKLTARLQAVAEAAEEVAGSLRSRLVPDEVSLEFGLKVSGGVNWFFAKAQGDAMYNLAAVLYQQGNKGETEQWLRKAAAAGHAAAVYSLGALLHEQGRKSEAKRWLKAAAAMQQQDGRRSGFYRERQVLSNGSIFKWEVGRRWSTGGGNPAAVRLAPWADVAGAAAQASQMGGPGSP